MIAMYVDDEKILLENFKLTVKNIKEIECLYTFNRSEEALTWIESNHVDIAFLDIEMPIMNGIQLARGIKEIDENIKIVFVTAYEQYALQAFDVDAIGYLLKPYTGEEIYKQIVKAQYIKPVPKKKVKVFTMPDFRVEVDGKTINMGHTKQEELFALLIDRGEVGITRGDAIACLWAGRPSDSIYWTTTSRLKNILEEEGIADIIVTKGQTKCINKDMVECDMYKMLEGDADVISMYDGSYLRRFSWAEERNAQLDAIKRKFTI